MALVVHKGLRHLYKNNSTSFIRSFSAILFPGQGAQHVGMAQDIYKKYKVARDVLNEVEEIVGIPLLKHMFEGPHQDLTMTANAQPAILGTSIALLRILETEFGLNLKTMTKFVLGHSLGEYSALVATNSLSLRDAVKLVRLRGLSMQDSVNDKDTTMKALVISEDHLHDIENLMKNIGRSLPKGEVADIANINSRSQIVLSGTQEGVDTAAALIQSRSFAGRAVSLPVSAPFHCRLMKPAADRMKDALEKTPFKRPDVDVISNVTSRPIQSREEIPELLYKQITHTVQWHRSIQYCRDSNVKQWIVIGPSRVWANLLKREYPVDRVWSATNLEDISNLEPFPNQIKNE